MKAHLRFESAFRISKNLPHQQGPDVDEIFGDAVGVHGRQLILSSNCGITYFSQWEDTGDSYRVSGEATFQGARNALNAIQGIQFPACQVTQIDSTLGRFRTLEDYDIARKLLLPLMRNVECFLRARHDMSNASGAMYCPGIGTKRVAQANEWLARVSQALSTVMDITEYGNPIHADGSRGAIC